ncbi:FG-GAP-like repeat-containing protein [Rubinisphaera margarita]|uniref:FG-GAP-like repeat-containing protein n=1 Tax=Rubinisphaera margarita TaxID=2909586 RepID=UPI001EE89F10|nr:FG-GAP-like repeat-containing protein [Rubinisphaera margarita]MCG6158254.1 FG-GAP-like repeat-containing protein [Rubinisphaera margarita]
MQKTLVPVALILIALIIALLLFLRGRQDGHAPGEPSAPLSTEEVATHRNRSLALMENQTPRESIPILEELLDRAPGQESFARQNLLVAIALALELENAEADPQPFQELFEKADSVLESEASKGMDGAEIAVLRSRIARLEGDRETFVKAARTAAEQAPESPAMWYELYLALKQVPSGSDAEAIAALARCCEAAPENVWALSEFLTELSLAKDSRVVEVVQQLQAVLAPFAPAMQQRSRVDVVQTLTETENAAREEDWALVTRNSRLLTNVLRPEDIAQSDRAVLVPNTLEFVSTAMPDDFAAALHAHLRTESPLQLEFTPRRFELPELSGEILHCEVADMNLNGRHELIVLAAGTFVVFQKSGEEWTVLFEEGVAEGYSRFLLADLDQDADAADTPTVEGAPCGMADLDVILFGSGGAGVLENQIRESGELVTHVLPISREVEFVTPGDFDLDGDLDLLVGTGEELRLLANYQQFNFQDISSRSAFPEGAEWTNAIAVDLDRDVDLDAVVISADRIGYLENLRHGELRWRPLDLGIEGEPRFTDVAVAELNADAHWDLLVASNGEIMISLSEYAMPGRVAMKAAVRTGQAADQFELWDADNDGWQDLSVLANDSEMLEFLRRTGNVEFTGEKTLLKNGSMPQEMLIEDVDLDGDLDLVTWANDAVSWHDNLHGNKNGYLKITLLGQQVKGEQAAASGRVNQYGWGSLLELKAGTVYQAQVASRPTSHFGLGDLQDADVLRVVWTNGIPQNVIEPQRNSVLCEELKLKGSCPYLYTWNGTEFEFYTDLLWAAPVGLQFAEGVLAPTRPWEYLLIEGDRLKDVNGRYRLQITEELWEAAYFDQVELIAVDHPADITVYSNEKVASSEIPEFKVHTVRTPHHVKAAVDSQGRDVLSQIAARDDIYTKLFDFKHYQGVTNEHFLELDLGDVAHDQPIKLYLTGWVYPSDTSINVALSQNPAAPSGRPPFLQVQNETGEWVTTNPSMGFPGGKTKTIVVDLTDAFQSSSSKVRIVTSMEVYWDHIFFTTGEAGDEESLQLQSLELLSADLHYRGSSRMIRHPGNGPERFDYQDVITTSLWPAMSGPFTTYGDVAELVRREDDVSVVMGAGDEMTVIFAAPAEPLPVGWKRDFMLHNVGYDKDADLNTIYGRTSEPFPTRDNPINPLTESTTPATQRKDVMQNRVFPQRRFWSEILHYSADEPAVRD